MHGYIGRDSRPYRQRALPGPVVLLCAACAIGVMVVSLGKTPTRALPAPVSKEPAPTAILPTPARLRRRSERLA